MVFAEWSVRAERRGDREGEGHGVGDLVRKGVGGIEVGDAVHVREQIAQVGEEQRAQMTSKPCAVLSARRHDIQLGIAVVIATGFMSFVPTFGDGDIVTASFRRFEGLVAPIVADD